MKRTQTKDTIRNIRGQFVSWLSIAVIAAIAVTAFLGIRFSAEALRANADRFYDEALFRDAEVRSTLMLSEEDLDAICAADGVRSAEGIRQTDDKLRYGGTEEPVTLLSLTDTVNRPILLSGHFPETADECLIEPDTAAETGLAEGDVITFSENEYLNDGTFTVSGIAVHPDHAVIRAEVPRNRYVMIPAENFSADAYDDCYTGAYVLFEKENAARFTDAYRAEASPVLTAIKELGEDRAAGRQEELRKSAQEAIEDAEAKIADAEAEIADNEEALKDAEEELADAEKTLKEKQAEIADAEADLQDAYDALSDSRREIDDGKEELEEAASDLADAREKLASAYSDLVSSRKKLADGYGGIMAQRVEIQKLLITAIEAAVPGLSSAVRWESGGTYNVDDASLSVTRTAITDSYAIDMTRDIKKQLLAFAGAVDLTGGAKAETAGPEEDAMRAAAQEAARAAMISAIGTVDTGEAEKAAKTWEDGHKAYIAGRRRYEASLAEYNENVASYNKSLADYNEGLAEYEEKLAEYDDGKAELEEARTEIAEKEADYREGLSDYEDAKRELSDGRKELSDAKQELADAAEEAEEIPDGLWVVLGVRGNASFVYTKSLSGNFADISTTFSLLFVFIGALVIYATSGKIIEEQRKQVGTVKALGFFNREILKKYLTFAVSAVVTGIAAGAAAAYFLVEKNMLAMQAGYFYFDAKRPLLETWLTLLVALLGLILAVCAVALSCWHLIRTPAVSLMQDAEVKGRKRGGASPRGSLYMRLVFRNMLSDKKRVAVTVVSVAGCCALMVIGLSIRHAMSSAMEIQFNDIYRYDYILDFEPDGEGTVEKAVEDVLSGDASFIRVLSEERSFLSGDELDRTTLYAGDPAEMAEFTLFPDPVTLEPLTPSCAGVYVPEKMDETGHYSEEGAITLYDENMNPYEVKTAGVFMSYIARFLVMTEEEYEKTFDKEAVPNEYLIRMDADTAEERREALEGISGVRSFTRSADRRENFASYIGIADAIVVFLTVMAFVMAFFILLNIVANFINQKHRELVIMRVNGFTVREVKAYVGWELFATTAAGILLGIAAGSVIGRRIIILLENINCFDRRLYYGGWLIAAAVTAGLSFMISAIALRKVRQMKLSDLG